MTEWFVDDCAAFSAFPSHPPTLCVQECNLGYFPSQLFLCGRLSSSSKDGSKRFVCHLCSNIVKCSRNGALNDRDRAQSKETWKQLSWKSGAILRRQVIKSGAEPYPNLMLLIKPVTWHKAFSSPNLSIWLGWGWKFIITVAEADCIEDNRAARDQCHKTC